MIHIEGNIIIQMMINMGGILMYFDTLLHSGWLFQIYPPTKLFIHKVHCDVLLHQLLIHLGPLCDGTYSSFVIVGLNSLLKFLSGSNEFDYDNSCSFHMDHVILIKIVFHFS